MNPAKSLILWAFIAFGTWMMLASVGQRASMQAWQQIDYSKFLTEQGDRQIKRVEIEDQIVRGERFDGSVFTTIDPKDPGLIGDLVEQGVQISAIPPAKPSFLAQLLAGLLPILLVVGFLYLIMRRSLKGGGPGSVMGFGKSKAREFKEGDIKTTLRDVAGVEEAKVEVAELVEFLCDPKRFVSVGGLIPGGSKWWARQERVRRCSPGQ